MAHPVAKAQPGAMHRALDAIPALVIAHGATVLPPTPMRGQRNRDWVMQPFVPKETRWKVPNWH